ncbi:hypothetical protein [Marinitenerispora sediminis]|uniref:hypothetical protein n=1 Tax=Marinitenerispora sediminis TaxID=1931232 RepID=UPI0011C03851|nr:hypothetical protein [Marinitenerispora sediminis]
MRLIVEVMDHWSDFGLTSGERSDLVVIAENANDATRETYGSIHAPYILHRAGDKSAGAWKNAIGKLMKKGVLEHVVRDGRVMSGGWGQTAQYRIPHLCPRKGHDGLWGQCARPTQGHPSGDPVDSQEGQQGHLSGDPKGHSSGDPQGHLSGDPFPSVPSQSPHPPSPEAQRSPKGRQSKKKAKFDPILFIAEQTGLAQDIAERFLAELHRKHEIDREEGFLRHLADNGDLGRQAQRWRTRTTPRDTGTCAFHRTALPCASCIGDIRAGDPEIPLRLLAQYGPENRPDLAHHLMKEAS